MPRRATEEAIDTAFGSRNRARLLAAYFASSVGGRVTPATAWAHVYRLLLWTDQRSGLAHCYESDKSQPGRRWYARSLAFHAWVAAAIGSTPANLRDEIDWMFRKASVQLAAEVARGSATLAVSAARQRKPYEGRGFPEPGEAPELIALLRDSLGGHLAKDPTPAEWGHLVQRLWDFLWLENKRKNLLGEGFEDVLGAIIERTCLSKDVAVLVRAPLHELPGFSRPREGEKKNKVDVALIRASMRTLITAKWSVRADRERQFKADFSDYVAADSARHPFEYVFVTNEFDPARLVRACEDRVGNERMFAHVVHVNTDALRAAYGDSIPRSETPDGTLRKVIGLIDSGRLISLERWLRQFAS